MTYLRNACMDPCDCRLHNHTDTAWEMASLNTPIFDAIEHRKYFTIAQLSWQT